MGKYLTAMLAAKRLSHVAPEVDLGECTLHSPLQKQTKRICQQKSKTVASVASKIGHVYLSVKIF